LEERNYLFLTDKKSNTNNVDGEGCLGKAGASPKVILKYL
jgi:hypothetical protein